MAVSQRCGRQVPTISKYGGRGETTLLTGGSQLKRLEVVANFGVGFVIAEYTMDVGVVGPLVRPDGERINGVLLAANQRFYATVAAIAYPAAQAERHGFVMQRPAETDALHTPFDLQVAGDDAHRSLAEAGDIAVRMPCMSCNGVGGQPGIETSTGMTLSTRPQEA